MAPVAQFAGKAVAKIAQSGLGKAIKGAVGTVKQKGLKQSLIDVGGNVKNKAVSVVNKTKTGMNNVKTYFKGAPTGVTPQVNTQVTTAAKTTTDAGKAAIRTSDAAKAAKTASDAKRANLLMGMTTAASVGVGYYQVKSANKQYKDSVARTNSYNAALRAEEDAATAAKNKADAEYASRADAYNYALATSQTSTSNIYSDGYAGDSIFSSSWRHPKYSIL